MNRIVPTLLLSLSYCLLTACPAQSLDDDDTAPDDDDTAPDDDDTASDDDDSAPGDDDDSAPGDDDDVVEAFVYLSDLEWSDVHRVQEGGGPFVDASGFDPHIDAPIGGFAPIVIEGITYLKGVAWASRWIESWVEWPLDSSYSSLVMKVRIDDYRRNPSRVNHEWSCVNGAANEHQFICRPEGHQTAEEQVCPTPGSCAVPCVNDSPLEPTCAYDVLRVGAGGRLRILGDGQTLLETGEFYGYGSPLDVEVDVTGVDVLRVHFLAGHTEQPEAPYRTGLASPQLVQRTSWFDLVDLADARLIE